MVLFLFCWTRITKTLALFDLKIRNLLKIYLGEQGGGHGPQGPGLQLGPPGPHGYDGMQRLFFL